MKAKYLITTFLLIAGLTAFAQKQIKGKVTDKKGDPALGINVNLKDNSDDILSFTRTNDKGEYQLTIPADAKDYKIEFTGIGYQKVFINAIGVNYNIVLQDDEINLKTVTVKNRPSLAINGDTINYKTSDFSDKQDRSIGDVLKKMPGMEVSEDGKVSYNGKSISNLYIDGDNLLDDKYSIGTKSIPHGVVDKVQVIKNDQPIKMLQKNNTSDAVALNLVIKDEAKLKVMGDIKAGLGTPDRFDGNINAMMFNKELKFLNNLKGNNIGIDPGLDLTAFNFADYQKRVENNKPDNFLSAGAAGVPTLPQTRSLFNKAGLANLNNLYKINKDFQLKANIAYLYDQRDQVYEKYTETKLPNGQTIKYSEIQNNALNPQKLQAKFNLNNNTDLNYLDNNLKFEYTPSNTASNVVINGIGATQNLNQEKFDLSNELSYRKKLKSSNIFNLYSLLNWTTQPEILNIRPGLNEDILNSGISYAGLNQYIKMPTWFTNNFASMALVNNNFTHTYKAGFSLQKQNLTSELYSVQNDESVKINSSAVLNNIDWLKSKIYTEGTLEFSNDKIKATLNLPLSYNRINYDDQIKLTEKNLEKLLFTPSFNLKYQVGSENYFTTNYSFKNNLGTIDDIYSGIILKNYRSLYSNDAPISESKVHLVGGGFNFRKAMQMLFANVNINYSNTTINTISSYNLTDDVQQRVVLPLENQIKNFSVSGGVSKYLFKLKSTINAGIIFSTTKLDQLQNGTLLPFKTQNINYKAGIESKLTNFINWSYNATYSVTDNKSEGINPIKTNFQQLRQNSSLTATAFKTIFFTLSGEHIFTHQTNQANLNYLFADFNVKYRINKYKTDLEFGVTNLANIKKFEAINVSTNSYTSGTYYIPGRVAMLKATFNF